MLFIFLTAAKANFEKYAGCISGHTENSLRIYRVYLFERSMSTPEKIFSPKRNDTTSASSMM